MIKLDKEKILQEIKEKGVEFASISDLLKLNKSYKDLIPVILKHLTQTSNESDKDLLIRSLGVKGFNEATETLIQEFYKAESTPLKWAIGNSLSIILDKSSLPALVKIAQEKEHGIARQMVVVALGKMKEREVIPILIELLKDEDVVGHAIMALGYFKDPEMIQYIEPFTEYNVRWIRSEAKKTIKKINKVNKPRKSGKESKLPKDGKLKKKRILRRKAKKEDTDNSKENS